MAQDLPGLDIELAGQPVRLLGERALWWPARRTLVAADLHWGKDASFRRAGVAVPAGELDDQLDRLSRMLEGLDAQRLLVLGDLIHDARGLTPRVVDQIAAWRRAHLGRRLILVRGNHDRHAPRMPSGWRLEEAGHALLEPPFVWVHEPTPHPDGHAVGGHLHPTTRLRAGADELRLPCFQITPEVTTLPAFTPFSAGPVVRRGRGARTFAIGDGEVFDVTPP